MLSLEEQQHMLQQYQRTRTRRRRDGTKKIIPTRTIISPTRKELQYSPKPSNLSLSKQKKSNDRRIDCRSDCKESSLDTTNLFSFKTLHIHSCEDLIENLLMYHPKDDTPSSPIHPFISTIINKTFQDIDVKKFVEALKTVMMDEENEQKNDNQYNNNSSRNNTVISHNSNNNNNNNNNNNSNNNIIGDRHVLDPFFFSNEKRLSRIQQLCIPKHELIEKYPPFQFQKTSFTDEERERFLFKKIRHYQVQVILLLLYDCYRNIPKDQEQKRPIADNKDESLAIKKEQKLMSRRDPLSKKKCSYLCELLQLISFHFDPSDATLDSIQQTKWNQIVNVPNDFYSFVNRTLCQYKPFHQILPMTLVRVMRLLGMMDASELLYHQTIPKFEKKPNFLWNRSIEQGKVARNREAINGVSEQSDCGDDNDTQRNNSEERHSKRRKTHHHGPHDSIFCSNHDYEGSYRGNFNGFIDSSNGSSSSSSSSSSGDNPSDCGYKIINGERIPYTTASSSEDYTSGGSNTSKGGVKRSRTSSIQESPIYPVYRPERYNSKFCTIILKEKKYIKKRVKKKDQN